MIAPAIRKRANISSAFIALVLANDGVYTGNCQWEKALSCKASMPLSMCLSWVSGFSSERCNTTFSRRNNPFCAASVVKLNFLLLDIDLRLRSDYWDSYSIYSVLVLSMTLVISDGSTVILNNVVIEIQTSAGKEEGVLFRMTLYLLVSCQSSL